MNISRKILAYSDFLLLFEILQLKIGDFEKF